MVLEPHTSTPRKLLLAETGIMGGLDHIRVNAKDNLWPQHSVRIIQLVICVLLNLVLKMVMVKVVWVIGPHTLPTRKLIDGFMVVILFHIRVGKINP